MLESNLEYYIGGFSFLGIIVVAMRLLWKLQSSGEAIYEKRSERQIEEIERLDASLSNIRRSMEKCHEERAALAFTVQQLQTQVNILSTQVALTVKSGSQDSADIAHNTLDIANNTADIAKNTKKD